MAEETELELLRERVDELNVALEGLRQSLSARKTELEAVKVAHADLLRLNRDLSAQIDRLRLHLQQGIEL